MARSFDTSQNPEFGRGLGRENFLEVFDRAHNRAQESLAEEAIDERDFEDLYSPKTVRDDRAYVAEMERRFESSDTLAMAEIKRMSTVFEALMNEQIELNEWLGPDVKTRTASRFDDIKNGVDSIAEIEHETSTSHLALAFDITHGHDLTRKMARIKREIDQATLTEVKYFESSDGTFKGKLAKVPRVVIGADRETLKELINLWMSKRNKDLAIHPIQLQIIDEIVMQLEAFQEYAVRTGKNDIAQIYARQLALVRGIQTSKQGLYRTSHIDTGYLFNDRVFSGIQESLAIFSE